MTCPPFVVTILGSGTSTGVPMVGCSCPVCTSDDPRDRRTRASILIESEGRRILVDTSTDLRRQALSQGIPRIDAILFTHDHADHVNGIDDMRGFYFHHHRAVPCYGLPETIRSLQRKFGYIFTDQPDDGYPRILTCHEVEGPFRLFGLAIDPIPLPHGRGVTTGYRIGPFAYVTDCSSIPEELFARFRGVETLLIDGLRHTPHPNHMNIPAAIESGRRIGAARTVLTHLTHEILARDDRQLPQGVEFAWDGMKIRFDGR